MATHYDCEPFPRALEEPADSMRGAATALLEAMDIIRTTHSIVRSTENETKIGWNDQKNNDIGA